ncbi:MAG TPA: penicillin acylase family protein [Burkholderiaceae bacterium]|nr:penicillin acylase family protein [Burkholderiaceae bacterium]
MSRLRRLFGVAAVAALWAALALGAAIIGWRMLAMPQASGELTVHGLHAELRLLRDRDGVVHVLASTPDDAYFGLGFAHGQDRLWQLEMNRRIVAGRLSEVLGPATLPTDLFLRTLGVRRNAERIVASLDTPTRTALQAYSDGINAAASLTRSRPWRLSPEFLVLGVRPEPWTPADSVGWLTMMNWDLSGNHATELLRFELSEKLTSRQIAQLFDLEAVETADFAQLYRDIARKGVTALIDLMPAAMVEGAGSNNWVLDGTRTVSGRPLLANDPHLGLSAPSLWYLAHLSAPGLEVIGGTIPGLPFVVLGRNDRIAWGSTNTGPDTQDLYLERIEPTDPARYRGPDGPLEFSVRTEVFSVKGRPDVVHQVRETRHGPVISDAMPALAEVLRSRRMDQRFALAFAWTALRSDDRSIRAGLRINYARDWSEFLEAARDLHGPQQNLVYADVDGNIGFIAAGRVPVRRLDNDLRGLAPAPGWDPRYDWIGFVPFEELPQTFRPKDGVIVTANQRVVGKDYPHFLTAEWTLSFRHDRIVDLLSRQQRHDATSFARMQADTVSLAVRELLPRLLSAPAADNPRAKWARELLSAWDATMAVDRPEPLIATAWIDTLRRLVFEDEVGPELFVRLERHRGRHKAVLRALTDPAMSHWCDDVTTTAVETCDQQIERGLEIALAELSRRHGDAIHRWRWGHAHPALSEHRPFGRNRMLAPLFDVRLPAPGDQFTVNAASHEPWRAERPFAARHGPAYRAIYDLADPQASVFIQSTGQSGHRLSPRYSDLARRWVAVEYLPMRTDRRWIERDARHELRLRPGPAPG